MLRAPARAGDPLERGRSVAGRYRAPVDVVAAALVQDGRVLAARRRTPPGWEFPGGKVEAGETPQQALVRECREELAIEVECLSPLGVANDARIRLQLWHARLVDGEPRAYADHTEVRWLAADTLDDVDWLAVDRGLLDGVRGLLS